VEGGKIDMKPRLPSAWTKLSFSLRFREEDYRVSVMQEGYTMEKREARRNT
jgi:trehalose/maltose hydrolase-like predicted phosphorylase